MPGDSATNRIPAVDHTRSHALPAARERSATESVEHAGAGSSARADCEPTGGQRAGTGEQRERMQGCSQLHDSHWSSGCRSPAFHCCSASSCALPSAPPPPLATAMSAAPTQMKAILLKKPGGPANIEYGDAPKPTPKANELLVKIYGTAINRADTLQSDLMGLECVGEVVELGQGASKYPVGTRVMCLLGGGGYAQYVAVDEGSCMKIPDSIDYATASAIPEVWLTAYMISRLLGGLKEGDVVLIHAGASGVGTSLIQLCRLFGATPIVTVGSSRKGDICKELGAAHYVDYKKTPKFSDDIKQFLSTLSPKKDGVDLVLDPVGASHAVQNLDVLALDGRWILYGTMGGPEVDKFSIGTLLRKRIQLQGTTLRSRTLDYKATLVEKFSRECLAAFESGQLKPIIDATMPLRDMQKAHELMEKNDTVGKICIQVEH